MSIQSVRLGASYTAGNGDMQRGAERYNPAGCSPLASMNSSIAFSREWAMPSGDTFTVPPIGEFVRKYLAQSKISVDPFARNNQWATFTNDLSRNTLAERHMDAPDFLAKLVTEGVKDIDLAIIDPPYSPRQVAEHYRSIGLAASKADTQIAGLYARTRSALLPLLAPQATVLSFGWNSAGMGKQHGFEIREVLLVAHGGAHNDTICIAETRP